MPTYNYILDFCKNYIKIIRAVRTDTSSQSNEGKEILIDKIFVFDLKELSEEKVNNFFNQLLSSHKFNLITFITRQDTTIKYIQLPSTSADEVSKMIEFQLEKRIPYPTEEISFDYQIQSVDARGYSHLMVAIAHKKKIATILDNFKNYGLGLDSIMLDVDTLCNWFNSTCNILDKPVGLIDIDAYKVNLIIIKEGKIDFSRSISVGCFDLDNGKNKYVLNKLIDEIMRSLTVYEKDETKENVQVLTITGAEGSLGYIKEELGKHFSGNIKTKSCFENVPLAFASDNLKEKIQKDFSFSYLVGAGLPFKQEKFEFLPHELRVKKELEAKKTVFKKIGIAFIVLIIVTMGIVLHKFYLLNKKLMLLNTRLEQITPEVKEVKEEVSLMRKLSHYLQNRNFSLDILREIYVRIPESITLAGFELDGGENLILRGEAEEISDVFSFVSSLEKSSYFSKVSADNVDVSQRTTKEVVNFEIYCKVK